MSKKDLKKEVEKEIDCRKKITFALYQKLNFIGHTGIVLIFDGTPRFTLDFGPDGEDFFKSSRVSSATMSSYVAEGLAINIYDDKNMKKIYDIKSFSCKETKKHQIFKKLLEIRMGRYHLLHNNCRDHVIKCYKVIAESGKKKLNKDETENAQRVRAALDEVEKKEITTNEKDFPGYHRIDQAKRYVQTSTSGW